jgi:hypothetical protein
LFSFDQARGGVGLRGYGCSLSLLQRIIQAPETFVATQGGQNSRNVGRHGTASQSAAHRRSDFSEAYAFFLSESLKLGFEGEDIPTLEKAEAFTES